MLRSRDFGYAVMNKKLTAIGGEFDDIETCKRYCVSGDVIAERIPYVRGFSIKVMWYEFHRPFNFKYGHYNILWLHWNVSKKYLHKTGKVVYPTPSELNNN